MNNLSSSLPPAAQALIERIENRQARIGVVGLGYVGLPLVMVLIEAGFNVHGVDLDPHKIEQLSAGISYVEDVPSAQVVASLDAGQLSVSSDYQDLAQADAVCICVPTPLRKTGDPDLSYIVSSVRALQSVLHPGMALILESTSYPGTTREMVLPEIEAGGLKVGQDLFLAFSPERVDPGREDWTTRNTPKVIGGITAACTRVCAAIYQQAMEQVVPVSSAEVAEMTKLLENTFRAVNIGLVNEMALMCERLGIDVWEVIDAAATKPFGFMKFTPGPGLGGHCIPIDPLYLSWKLKSVKYTARFIELASEINTGMPRHVVRRVQDALNEHGKALRGSQLLILGVAYKPDVSDTRESPALDIIGLLSEKGAEVAYYDPYVERIEHEGWDLSSEPDLQAALSGADCVVIVTHHQNLDYEMVLQESRLIFDARNALRGLKGDPGRVVRL